MSHTQVRDTSTRERHTACISGGMFLACTRVFFLNLCAFFFFSSTEEFSTAREHVCLFFYTRQTLMRRRARQYKLDFSKNSRVRSVRCVFDRYIARVKVGQNGTTREFCIYRAIKASESERSRVCSL